MASNAFGGINTRLTKLILEKQNAYLETLKNLQEIDTQIQNEIQVIDDKTEEAKTSIASVGSSSVQFPISENVSDQIGHTDNRFDVSTTWFHTSVCVYYNGIKQVRGEHFEVSGQNRVYLLFTPQAGSFVEVSYVPQEMGSYASTALPLYIPS